MDLRISWRHVNILYSRAEEEHVYYLNYPAAEFTYNICEVGRWQSSLLAIVHVRYINILTWLRGFQVKPLYLVLFSLYLSLFCELRDKGNLKNLQFWPESLGAMLEYWYIDRRLLNINIFLIWKKEIYFSLTIMSLNWKRNKTQFPLQNNYFKLETNISLSGTNVDVEVG